VNDGEIVGRDIPLFRLFGQVIQHPLRFTLIARMRVKRTPILVTRLKRVSSPPQRQHLSLLSVLEAHAKVLAAILPTQDQPLPFVLPNPDNCLFADLPAKLVAVLLGDRH
jgi:hypothetical protein